jgi:uncharacterized protein with FMN-binding domain
MKKIIASLLVVVPFILYASFNKVSTDNTASYGNAASAPMDNPSNSSVIKIPSKSTQTTKTTNKSGAATVNPKKYNNGSYIGKVADAYYGNVQVRVTISQNKISDVEFLQYPHDRGHSIQVNNYAMPILKQEVILAQSSKVDTVSGATATSGAFIQSMESALSQART